MYSRISSTVSGDGTEHPWDCPCDRSVMGEGFFSFSGSQERKHQKGQTCAKGHTVKLQHSLGLGTVG